MALFIRVPGGYLGSPPSPGLPDHVVHSPRRAWKWPEELLHVAQGWCDWIPDGEVVDLSDQEISVYDVHEE